MKIPAVKDFYPKATGAVFWLQRFSSPCIVCKATKGCKKKKIHSEPKAYRAVHVELPTLPLYIPLECTECGWQVAAVEYEEATFEWIQH